MSDAEALLQRLLTDPEFRAGYRRDPAAAARAAGFDDAAAAGRALETLELRESRQALLGALGAAAVEGIALIELSEHVVPGLGDLLPHVEEAQAAARPSGGGGVLDNDHIVFDADGIADLEAGRIDPRIVAVLDRVSRDHDIVVSSMRSDHPQLTTGGSVSNHASGRAVDIAMVDGKPVNASNEAARRLILELNRLDPAIRPDEIGSPWAMPGPEHFTDADHQDHLHLGFDDPIDPTQPPPVDPGDADDANDVDDPDDAGHAGDAGDAEDVDDGDVDDVDEDDGDEDDGDEDDGDEDDGDEDDGDEEEDSNEPPSAGDDDGDEPDEDEPDEEEPDEEEPDEDEPDEDDDEPDDEEPDEVDASGESLDADDSDADEDPDSHDDNSDSDGHDDDSDSDDDDSDERDAPDDDDVLPAGGPLDYPGDDAGSARLAAWMGHAAQRRGLPPELPVMAALVESGMTNADHGDADSLGFFQMRTSVWDRGPYAGYADNPELQLKWFLDTAERVGSERRRHGLPMDARHFGEWIADVERPAAQYRGRYQLRLEDARELLRALAGDSTGPRALSALSAAERRLGRGGFDGPGLVKWAYRQAGIELARLDAPGGRPVRRDTLLPGDLVLFRNAAGEVDHAGISLGGHRFIQAPRGGGAVEIASLRDHASEFAGGRRFGEAVRVTGRDARARVLPIVAP